ncbi:MAG: hypothetical protein H6744_20235 [Deltaproteobacteria bacterium]|nr:hypothetical protein [Deltaproteobacteria bacterium]
MVFNAEQMHWPAASKHAISVNEHDSDARLDEHEPALDLLDEGGAASAPGLHLDHSQVAFISFALYLHGWR